MTPEFFLNAVWVAVALVGAGRGMVWSHRVMIPKREAEGGFTGRTYGPAIVPGLNVHTSGQVNHLHADGVTEYLPRRSAGTRVKRCDGCGAPGQVSACSYCGTRF